MKKLSFFLLLFVAVMHSYAQQSISGQVTDEFGEPLIGATVLESNTSNGSITNVNGEFFLSVSSLDSSLTTSYVGYETTTTPINGQSSVKIILKEDQSALAAVTVVGSRSYQRTTLDSPVPVDVIDVNEIAATTGRTEINAILQYSAPSFNATKQSGSDGADHVDPASLRGLGPDQSLVLINGKRRHQSSLINIFGTRGRGNTGTDLNAIPSSAIKRLEVLRDGASAQYGSDAIAGVINIVLKDETDGVTGSISTGAYSTAIGGDYTQQIFDTQDGWEPELFNIEGKNRIDGKDKSFDGLTTKLDLNYGVNLGEKGGYINLTGEYLDKDRTLRPSFDWRKGYGSAAAEQFQFMVNSAFPLSANTELYAFGGKGIRDTDAYAFSRSAPGADGDDRAVASLYPNGFSPHITSQINDDSFTGGVKSKLKNGWMSDFSNSYGRNNFHYFIEGTNNASLGDASPTSFDAGGHNLTMNVTSMDFSKFFDDVASGFNVAFGAEYRTENYEIFAGEEGSYATYDTNGLAITNPTIQTPFVNEFGQAAPGGSQGFPGYSPSNTVDENRSNVSLYADAEINPSEDLLVSGALRFEKYSDFGSTLNYKLASRLEATDELSLRGSISSGFRAPSLAQIHYNLLFNNIVAGRSERTLLASNTSTVAKAFGIQSLKEETATNTALGVTYEKGNFSASIDGYLINVDDRIILTDVFDATSLNVGAEAAQFFANGLDTQTSGIDFVLAYDTTVGEDNLLKFNLAGNVNDTKIKNINSGNLNEYTFFGPFSQAYLEAAAPDYKVAGMIGFVSDKFNASANWTQFSEVLLQDFQWVDDPATNAQEAAALYETATDTYEAKGVLDVSLGYNFTNDLMLTIGANNLLNTYPTQQFDGWTDQGGFNDSVQMGSDGMNIFGRFGFKF